MEKKFQFLISKKLKNFFFLVYLFFFTLQVPLHALPLITLNKRQICDLELLLNGAFSPLEGFMDQQTYEDVVHKMRLPDGTLWPIPITLDIQEKNLKDIEGMSTVALKDEEGFTLAILTVSEIWKPNKKIEAEKIYQTTSLEHPGVDYLFHQTGDYYIGGKIEKIEMPKHYDFIPLRLAPQDLKNTFKEKGINKVVAFQTRNPMHRAHYELTLRAAQKIEGHLLIQPAIGMTKPGDVDYFTRIKCYQKLLNYYPKGTATLSLLPIAMRMAGPKEALWHAIIRKNYGCTHFIIGRDHSGPGKDSQGRNFYEPYAAQEFVQAYSNEIGIEIVPFKEMVYVGEDQNYQPVDEVKSGKTILNISGTELRELLKQGLDIPSWFTFPEIAAELKKVYPPRLNQGFTIFFTGLSGAGKSTIAKALNAKLMEVQERPITLLDGDIIRRHLSTELGFSKEHRSLNVRRVGFVAGEITKNRGAAICALIAPYEEDRRYNRNLINHYGSYIEIYLSTSLDECIRRDTKGLYALAKEGKLMGFTGISDPYEIPQNPELTIDTTQHTISETVNLICDYLRQQGLIKLGFDTFYHRIQK